MIFLVAIIGPSSNVKYAIFSAGFSLISLSISDGFNFLECNSLDELSGFKNSSLENGFMQKVNKIKTEIFNFLFT